MLSLSGFAQTQITGTVIDESTGETVIGANVTIEGQTLGTVTDLDGRFTLSLNEGKYSVKASMIGYDPQVQDINVKKSPLVLTFKLKSQMLDEVEISADVIKGRQTPVAYANVNALKIQEELGGRDMPMVMNSTPGVYATEQGGGSGDARITLRGFDQRNIAVMVDGVPVNDMENGQVYWSNWDGLADITRTVQIQRGLGASRLAIPSVGGTMNIITKGIDAKRSIILKQEAGNDLMLKTMLSYTSGPLKGGWGVTLAGSRKTGRGFANETWSDLWSYFFKVQKRAGDHLFSLSASGAPQKHGQRTDRLPMVVYSSELASRLGINVDSALNASGYTTTETGDRGLRYNSQVGILNGEEFNNRVNYYHKPQINLSHFWNKSERFFLSNILYASIGKGGGTRLNSSINRDIETGLLKYDSYYQNNSTSIDNLYSATENKSNRFMQSSVNNHFWYGLISTANITLDTGLVLTTGLDLRYYRGEHYTEVYDLLGGDYITNTSDKNQPYGINYLDYSMKRKGDKINYHNDGLVFWGGTFAQIELSKQKWNTFFTATFSETGYQRIDYFKKKDLVLPSGEVKEQELAWGDTVTYDGVQYTNDSPEARFATTKRKWFPGFTLKSGASYEINRNHTVFVNAGYLELAPKFNNVFDNANKETKSASQQKVSAVEAGYSLGMKKVAANLNLYHTIWKNKPLTYSPTVFFNGDAYYYEVSGLDATHKGVEVDLSYKLLKNLEIESIVSLGDWRVNSSDFVMLYDQNTLLLEDTIEFSARNIHVGDAAQIQLGGSVRYEPIKNLYIKPRYTWFGKNYANFDLITLVANYSSSGKLLSDYRDRESWKLPNYGLLDVHMGYRIEKWKMKFDINGSIFNVLDEVYISDAQNGSKFNANTALVYMGPGTRFIIGLRITY